MHAPAASTTASSRDLAGRAGLPMPRVYVMNNPAAQRLRHRPQSRARRGVRLDRPARDAFARGGLGRAGARARTRQELRHAHHGGGGHHRRRHLHAGAVPPVRRPVRRPPRQQQRHRLDRRAGRHDRRAARRHAGADGDQPLARVPGRPARRHDLRPAAVARLGARQDRGLCAPDPQRARGSRARHRAPLHHQPAERRGHGQPVLDPPQHREPHRRAGEARGRAGRHRPQRAAWRGGRAVEPLLRRPRGPWG